MRAKDRNPWLLLLLLLVGLVLGGILGDVFQDTFKWLGYSRTIGFKPTTLDLNVLKATLGFTMSINLASVIGLIIAVLTFRLL